MRLWFEILSVCFLSCSSYISMAEIPWPVISYCIWFVLFSSFVSERASKYSSIFDNSNSRLGCKYQRSEWIIDIIDSGVILISPSRLALRIALNISIRSLVTSFFLLKSPCKNHSFLVNNQEVMYGSLKAIPRAREGANKRGNSSRLTQSFHFFMFEPIFSPVNALNQPI